MEKYVQKHKSLDYVGQLSEYQTTKKKTYMEYEKDSYSAYQNYLYKRALFGLNALTESELVETCSKKKERIFRVYKRGQIILNKLKQQITIQYSNMVFKSLFPNSPLTDFFLENTETDEQFKNTLTFKDLNISKDVIVNVFIKEGILPKNFMEITMNPNALPQLKKK